MRRVLLVLSIAAYAANAAPLAAAQPKDLARARAADKEGGKAYGEGRYADAIRFYDESYRLGGPTFELWNIAKCHLRLDQPEQAAEFLEKYLQTPNLPKDDREEASGQLDALKKRSSTLTVTSSPAGANVTVDGKAVTGATPLSIIVTPGQHTVAVSAPTGVPYTHQVEARYGRALVVEAQLKEGKTDPRPPPPPNPYEKTGNSIAIRAAVSVVVPRFGSQGGSSGAGFLALATYRIAAVGSGGGGLSVGGIFSATGDHWKNESGVTNFVQNKCNIPAKESATALSFYGVGTATFPISEKFTLAGIAGVGLTGLSHDELGSDVFLASCDPSPGVRPAFLFGAELDYQLGSTFRISAFPLTWHLQPAFEGVRGTPRDATGIWMRFGVGVGLGVDL